MDNVGFFIKVYRTCNNHSQEQLGELLYKDQGYISRIETGREEPDAALIMQIATIYNSVILEELAIGRAARKAIQKVLH